MTPRTWQEVYLTENSDDNEYNYYAEILVKCRNCNGEGILIMPGTKNKAIEITQLCDRCKGCGKVVAE